ncbi:hypothetical protein ACLOJK_024814 [Asimina triloba]
MPSKGSKSSRPAKPDTFEPDVKRETGVSMQDRRFLHREQLCKDFDAGIRSAAAHDEFITGEKKKRADGRTIKKLRSCEPLADIDSTN